jgi:C-terminal processing protease CtpA/Prc
MLPLLTSVRSALIAVSIAAVTTFSLAQGAGKPIGFSLEVSVDGSLNPKVTKVLVTTVMQGSLAQAAGLVFGDELIRVAGITVPGTSASVLRPHMEFVPGKPKRLAFKRADGTEYEATLTKGPSQ